MKSAEMSTETVDEYVITTDATSQRVAWLLGRAWQASFLRARLGRVVDLGGHTYRLSFLGNALVVTVTTEDGVTTLTSSVQQSRPSAFYIPYVSRLMRVDDVSTEVLRDDLCQSLRDRGHRVSVQIDQVEAPGLEL
jgi:hypothetical protein